MEIRENEEGYYLEFNNSEEAVLNFLSRRLRNYKATLMLECKEEGVERFKGVVKLIKRVSERYELIVKGGVPVRVEGVDEEVGGIKPGKV